MARNSSQNENDTLRQILLLLAMQALNTYLKDNKQREKIAFLNKAGFKNEQIANLLGTTPRTVIVELSALRKNSTKKKLWE